MSEYTHEIAVDRPLRDVYDQWTQMEEFPQFMDGVQQVTQVSDTRTHWRVSLAGVEREFDAEIIEQEPDRVMAWRSLDGPQQTGTVRFQPQGPDATVVTLTMHFEPEGLAENVGDFLGLVEDRVKGDLTRFKQFIESEKVPTGAWRGTVEHGAQTGAPSSAGTTREDAGLPDTGDEPGSLDDPSEPLSRAVLTDVPVTSPGYSAPPEQMTTREAGPDDDETPPARP